MIPVIGFSTFRRFDLAQRMLDSIDYPVEHVVIVDNSGMRQFEPVKPDMVQNLWLLQMPYGLGSAGGANVVIKSTPFAKYWIIASDDTHFAPGALAKIDAEIDTNALTFFDTSPDWCCIALGEGVVEKAGLCSELFHPAYYEDNDFERRIRAHGLEVKRILAKVHHDNSSSLQAGFHDRNAETFRSNGALFEERASLGVMSGGEWSLERRRMNSWD